MKITGSKAYHGLASHCDRLHQHDSVQLVFRIDNNVYCGRGYFTTLVGYVFIASDHDYHILCILIQKIVVTWDSVPDN